MFRFYCVRCNRVKRVQQVPHIISEARSLNPEKRIGECNFHQGIKTLNIGREKFRDGILDSNDRPYHSRFKYRNARNQSAPKINTSTKSGKGKRVVGNRD